MKYRRFIISLLAPLLLTQCARTLTPYSRLEYSYARATAPFAAISELAYETTSAKGKEEQQRKICRTFLKNSGWTPEKDFHESEAETKTGLQYTAWMNRKLKPNVLCIAFRGTEFLTEGEDMVSNLHPLLGRLPGFDQYEHIEHTVVPSFEKKYGKRIREGNLVVITTGHSLGGGLVSRKTQIVG